MEYCTLRVANHSIDLLTSIAIDTCNYRTYTYQVNILCSWINPISRVKTMVSIWKKLWFSSCRFKNFTSFVFVNKEPQLSMYFVKLTKLVSYLLNLDQTYQHVKSRLSSWNLFFFQIYVCFTYFSINKKCFITRTHVTVQVLKFFGKRHCLKELMRHCIKRKLCSINL